jgi:hypothetical protein
MSDIEFRGYGSIWLMVALTAAGQEWIDENIGEAATRSSTGIVVEHRYVADIVEGARRDGLEVSGVIETIGFEPPEYEGPKP